MDLTFALLVMLLLFVGALCVGIWLSRRTISRWPELFATITVALSVIFFTLVMDRPFLVWLIPLSSAIILTNGAIPLGGFLAGITWARIREPLWRKLAFASGIALATFYAGTFYLWGNTPETRNQWQQGVCLQSAEASCGAAAAATLLRAHEIPSTEGEMADLCLTRARGTPFLGLYRGLKIKTSGTTWKVAVVAGNPEGLSLYDSPLLLSVGLPDREDVDARYAGEWGWEPGVGHTVVLFGFDSAGRPEIGDPGVGREFWRPEDLRLLYQGYGLRLIPRAAGIH